MAKKDEDIFEILRATQMMKEIVVWLGKRNDKDSKDVCKELIGVLHETIEEMGLGKEKR